MITKPGQKIFITDAEGSWISSLLAIGAALGALPAGNVADRFGRKKTLLFLSAPFLISWAMIICGTNVWILYFARLLSGFGVGAACVLVPTYISEIAEVSARGTLCAMFQLFLTVGIVFAFVMGATLSYTAFAIVCGLVELVFLATFLWMPESPVWLVVCPFLYLCLFI